MRSRIGCNLKTSSEEGWAGSPFRRNINLISRQQSFSKEEEVVTHGEKNEAEDSSEVILFLRLENRL